MFVIKRDGTKQPVYFDKIQVRLQNLCELFPPLDVDTIPVVQKVVAGFANGMTTMELDNYAAETACYMGTVHAVEYQELAVRIAVSNNHKQTTDKFSEAMELLYKNYDHTTDRESPLVSEKFIQIVRKNKDRLDTAIDYTRDYTFDYFGFKTLERSYITKLKVLRSTGKWREIVVERPQHMWMRTAVGVRGNDIEGVLESYRLFSTKKFIHATPTLYNSAATKPTMLSCFLQTLKHEGDSIEAIYDTLKACAIISKYAGGVGLSIHTIRAAGSYIRGTNGYSNGIVPMLKVFDDTAQYVDQGGGKRKGAFAIYLEPWHADIFDFLDLKKNHGKEERRARSLFYGLWIPDLFMKRVESNGEWSLMCPNECPGLNTAWGEEFETLYTSYEKKGKARRVIKAQDLWFAIVNTQIETGTPYMLYKDSCNRKSNQQNLGTIQGSNLCCEIIEFSSKDKIAVCALNSIGLPSFHLREIPSCGGYVDYAEMGRVVTVEVKNANEIIDNNYYPLEEQRKSSMDERAIAIGPQGMADLFAMMRVPYTSKIARQTNILIFETMYYYALKASMKLAKIHGPYPTFKGSPASKGILQFDMWGVKPTDKYDWAKLKEKIKIHGLRNSLLIGPMPTASTSQIFGFNESFEPFNEMIYTRRTLAGEYTVINKHLVKELKELKLWSGEMRDKIISGKGSIQSIPEIPDFIKEIYKTVWEMSAKDLVDMACDRGAYIDQSQSFNLHMAKPTVEKLTSYHFYAWKKGLKTGMYYLRTKAAADAIQFTVSNEKNVAAPQGKSILPEICDKSSPNCDSCSA